jgi:hypothetical protein
VKESGEGGLFWFVTMIPVYSTTVALKVQETSKSRVVYEVSLKSQGTRRSCM